MNDPIPTPAPSDPAAPARSLEDLLSGLDDSTRAIVLGQVKDARSEAQNLRTRVKDLEPKAAEFDKLSEAQKSEVEKAQAAQAAAEARVKELSRSLVSSRVEALAAGKFANPADAHRFLDDLGKYQTADGVDEKSITADLDGLLADRTYLAAAPAAPGSRPPAHDPYQAAAPVAATGDPAADLAAFFAAGRG